MPLVERSELYLSLTPARKLANSPLSLAFLANIKLTLQLIFRELASFAQFGSELDDDTRERLAQGERIKEVLKQPQYQPLAVEKQIVIIYAVTRKYLLDVPVERIAEFEKGLYEFVETKYPEIYKAIRETGEINSETDVLIQKAITEFKNQF